jgi:hypothetical protein
MGGLEGGGGPHETLPAQLGITFSVIRRADRRWDEDSLSPDIEKCWRQKIAAEPGPEIEVSEPKHVNGSGSR